MEKEPSLPSVYLSSIKHDLVVTSSSDNDHQLPSPWVGPTANAPASGATFQVSLRSASVNALVSSNCFVTEFEPPEFVAVNVTSYVPSAAYVWLGLVSVDDSPSPKSQLYVSAFNDAL